MDEVTLNDLLECSVCLERLDTSSKVLPCQHTFCKKCLEIIIASKKELRCPECRVLVDVKIDDLPPNVLLMRILEGLKNSSQLQVSENKQVSDPTNFILNDTCNTNKSEKETKTVIKNQGHTSQEHLSRSTVPHAYALYNFTGSQKEDLCFKKGDIILLKRQLNINWLIGELNGREGTIPSNYVQIMVPLPTPQCIALYDFKMGPNEEEGCLSFKKDTIINVLRRVDKNWAEGRIGTCIGIFPIAFTEMNSLAKNVLATTELPSYQPQKSLPPTPIEKVSPDSNTTMTSPSSTCSSNTSSNSVFSTSTSTSNSLENNFITKNNDSTEKRLSLNLLYSNSNISQSNRHSVEVLDLSDSLLPTSSVERNGINESKDVSLQNSSGKVPSNIHVRNNISKSEPTLPWAYVALYPYKPGKPDELELERGCIYFVTERCLDGWYKGKNWADKSGVFPGNYVRPLQKNQQLLNKKKSTFYTSLPQQPDSTSMTKVQNKSSSIAINSNKQHLRPPELPPRNNNNSITSVWTKPLGHHVESLFCRRSSASHQKKDENTIIKENLVLQPNHVKDKDKKDHNSSSSAVNLMKRLASMKPTKQYCQNNILTNTSNNSGIEDVSQLPPKYNIQKSYPAHVRSGSCPSQLLQSLPIEIGFNLSDKSVEFGSQRLKGQKDRPSLHSNRLNYGNNLDNCKNNGNKRTTQTNKIIQKNSTDTPKLIKSQIPLTLNDNNLLISHRKSQSLDGNTNPSQISTSLQNGKFNSRERYRCIVAYPPNNDVELELNVGDKVYVHQKHKNGWYKGINKKTNKTGLFPASFVEPDI